MSKKETKEPSLMMDYYHLAFARFWQAMGRRGFEVRSTHPIRRQFWGRFQPSSLPDADARKYIDDYIETLERMMAAELSKRSVFYWLHLYRRLSPEDSGDSANPATALAQRAIFEAAIQKHGMQSQCGFIRVSSTVYLDEVLDGQFDEPEARYIQHILLSGPQWVLVHFTDHDLQRFLETEKLAYEVWRASAQRRALGKGAEIRIVSSDPYVGEARSDELDQLIEIYDSRLVQGPTSSSGIVFRDAWDGGTSNGTLLVPHYNVSRTSAQDLNKLYEVLYGVTTQGSWRPNIIWSPFNLRAFYESHRPLGEAFRRKHKISLEAVVVLIAAELLLVIRSWKHLGARGLRDSLRGYDLAKSREQILKAVMNILPNACTVMGIQPEPNEEEISTVIVFLTLVEKSRSDISCALHGPHQMYIPIDGDSYVVDYMCIRDRLYHLFFGVTIPDQNFKGDALESVTRHYNQYLPTDRLQSKDGTARQIDANALVGDTLFIIECRAFGKSFGFERGDPQAIAYRNERIEKALNDIDEKANWLCAHPEEPGFSLRGIRRIVPIAVTPFPEFVPSLAEYWWLRPGLPRVLTPAEVFEVLSGRTPVDPCWNAVQILPQPVE